MTPAPTPTPAAQELEAVRVRLHSWVDRAMTDPGTVSNVDQLAGALRRRFTECGVRLSDDEIRAALLVVTETLSSSLSPLAPICSTSIRMWAITAQVTAAVLTIDTHERGAQP